MSFKFAAQHLEILQKITLQQSPTDTCDGPSCTTVLVVRDPILKGLSRFLSVLQRTSTTDRLALDGPSCITVMTVRDPSLKDLHTFYKCPLTDNYNGPSYPRRSVLHDRCDSPRLFQVSFEEHLRRTVILVTVHPAYTVILFKDSPSGLSI